MNEDNKNIIINTTEGQDAKDAETKAAASKEAAPTPQTYEKEADDAAKQAVSDEEQAAKVKAAAIDEMEKASQKALDAMREENNEENSEIVDEAEKKIDAIYDDFRKWFETNTNPDKVKENLEKLREDTAKTLNDARERVIEAANSEQFKNTMTAGKDFVTGTAGMIGDGFKYGYDKLMEVPEFKKVADAVDEGVTKIRQNETLATIVDQAEKGINDLNNAVFKGLRSFFEGTPAKKEEPEKAAEPEKTAEPEKKDDLPDLPKDVK